MRRRARGLPMLRLVLLVVAIAAVLVSWRIDGTGRSGSAGPGSATLARGAVALSSLPVEARRTVRLIQKGGPFPYRRDGVVFDNREGLLPGKPRGYYHEYTVPTPGSPDRGARRIVTGGDTMYYTNDHYRSFHRIEEDR